MYKSASILVFTLLALFSAATSAIGSDSQLIYSGRIEASRIKFYEDGSGRPNKFEFSTTDGKVFVMYSNQVLLAEKGSLVDIQLSPVQSGEKLLVCAYEIKSVRIFSNEVESDLMFKEPQKFVTELGEGCN